MTRRSWWLACLGAVLLAVPAVACAGIPFRIVPSSARVAPGEWIQLAVEPAPDRSPDEPVRWVVEGRGVIIGRRYGAPWIVPQNGEVVRVTALRGPKGAEESAEATVKLAPGSVEGAQDCLGPGQTWSADGRSLESVAPDELPEAVMHPQPQYPKSSRVRDVHAELVVQALVCRSGRVLDATAQWGIGVTPIPELEALAIEAARQWVFQPARIAGQPVACRVDIPFRFPPP
jgi:TonB family protein